MSKRLLSLMTILLLLAVFSVTQAQETVSGEPRFVLTEEQINADFNIASTSTREISDLQVDVKEDGLHVSYQMTFIQDGTSNTLSIIAILIGLFDQPRVSAIELENTMVSNYNVPVLLRREVTRQLVREWNNYEAGVIAELPIELVPNQIIMRDGGICNPRWGC
jgi:hypothetical protein